ncbi:MAG TPA: DUF3795 domain-containing protein [Candidatus Gemmiger faecigallinarum]|nr:DUF3795 domain-containing protein [Candidatus Gemmiger faecigallinarum]
MTTYCGADCCGDCPRKADCGGCEAADGRPFGGRCIAAECARRGGAGELARAKQALIDEFNALGIPQLRVSDLNLLNGFYVNLEYPLPNGGTVKLLNDADIYWGNQIERPGNDRCYGIVGDDRHLLVCEYSCNGSDPEILVYQKRGLGTP